MSAISNPCFAAAPSSCNKQLHTWLHKYSMDLQWRQASFKFYQRIGNVERVFAVRNQRPQVSHGDQGSPARFQDYPPWTFHKADNVWLAWLHKVSESLAPSAIPKKLTSDIRSEGIPSLFLFFMFREVACIAIPVIDTIYHMTIAFVPAIQNLLCCEGGLLNHIGDNILEPLVSSSEDHIYSGHPTSRGRGWWAVSRIRGLRWRVEIIWGWDCMCANVGGGRKRRNMGGSQRNDMSNRNVNLHKVVRNMADTRVSSETGRGGDVWLSGNMGGSWWNDVSNRNDDLHSSGARVIGTLGGVGSGAGRGINIWLSGDMGGSWWNDLGSRNNGLRNSSMNTISALVRVGGEASRGDDLWLSLRDISCRPHGNGQWLRKKLWINSWIVHKRGTMHGIVQVDVGMVLARRWSNANGCDDARGIIHVRSEDSAIDTCSSTNWAQRDPAC